MNPSYDAILSKVLTGHRVSPRNSKTHEAVGPVTVSYSPGETVSRSGLAHSLGVMEGLMFVGGFFDLDLIKASAPKADTSLWSPFARYGPKVYSQWSKVINALLEDSFTRRAQLLIANDGDMMAGTDRLPCATSIQFTIRDMRLTSYVNFRSWDLVWGFPYDTSMFAVVTMFVDEFLRRRGIVVNYPVIYATTSSMHVYDHSLAQAKNTVKGRSFEMLKSAVDEVEKFECGWSEYMRVAQNLAYQIFSGNWKRGLPPHFTWGDNDE